MTLYEEKKERKKKNKKQTFIRIMEIKLKKNTFLCGWFATPIDVYIITTAYTIYYY